MILLLRQHLKILLFCGLVFVFVNLGQTYLISWWNPYIQEAYGFSRTSVGLIYAAATFLSSFFLPVLGKAVDHLRPYVFGLLVSLGLAVGFVIFSHGKWVGGLFLGYFIIRLMGQIGLSLLPTTILSRKFGPHRGKALSIAHLGRPFGEGILPGVFVYLIGELGWQQAALAVGLGFLTLFVPILLSLGYSINFKPVYTKGLVGDWGKEGEEGSIPEGGEKAFSRKRFYEDKAVWLVIGGNILVPFILTGLFFQQTSFAEMKGWSAAIMGRAFMIFGASGFCSTLFSGVLIDRFSATRLIPFPLLILLPTLGVLFWGQGDGACFVYLGLLGMTMGSFGNIASSFYAENFPLRHIGRIKGLDGGHIVRASAVAPIVFSYVLDLEVPMVFILSGLGVLCLLGTGLYFRASFIFLCRNYQ